MIFDDGTGDQPCACGEPARACVCDDMACGSTGRNGVCDNVGVCWWDDVESDGWGREYEQETP